MSPTEIITRLHIIAAGGLSDMDYRQQNDLLDELDEWFDGLQRPLIVGGKPRASGWEKAEKAHIEQYPTCSACGGKKLLQVHHIHPFHEFPEKELDPSNFLTLCMAPGWFCHFQEGHDGNWSCWNPDVVEDAAKKLKRVQNRVCSK